MNGPITEKSHTQTSDFQIATLWCRKRSVAWAVLVQDVVQVPREARQAAANV